MNEMYECQNCGFEDEGENLPMAKHLWERMTPGDTFTDVECPECGSLCFPVEPVTDDERSNGPKRKVSHV